MTEAARQILEAATEGGPEGLSDDEMKRMVWGLAKIQPLILDRIDELKQHNTEQDEYLFILKISWCWVRWLLDGNNRKYAVLVGFLGLNAIWTIAYVARCWT